MEGGNMVEEKITKYKVNGEELALSPDIIRKYLVNGSGKVTDQEIMMFTALCKFQKLNPFLREAYLIKYSEKSPATLVTGKETFLKRAQKNPKYQGHKSGIELDETGRILFAWTEVYVEGYVVPIRYEAYWNEYVAVKDEWKDNKKTGRKIPNTAWATKPRIMLMKCSLVGALREAFTEDFGGMYSPEEINTIDSESLPKQRVYKPDVQMPKAIDPNLVDRFPDDPITDNAPIDKEDLTLSLPKQRVYKPDVQMPNGMYSPEEINTIDSDELANKSDLDKLFIQAHEWKGRFSDKKFKEILKNAYPGSNYPTEYNDKMLIALINLCAATEKKGEKKK